MPKVSWSTFTDRHPAAHLVVAVLPIVGSRKVAAPRAKSFRAKLGHFLGRLGLDGDYATTIDRPNGHREIHAGFEKRVDADRLARAVQATTTGRYQGWASQRLFVLDDPTRTTIEADPAAHEMRAIANAPLGALTKKPVPG